MGSKKGQAWGMDLVVGLVIFVLGVIFFYIYSTNSSGGNGQELAELQKEARLVGGMLLTEGTPSNWTNNVSGVVRIGLLENEQVSNSKLAEFSDLIEIDYQKTKVIFGITNEYYVEFSEDIFSESGVNSVGNLSVELAKNIVVSERAVVYNGEILSMKVYVWN